MFGSFDIISDGDGVDLHRITVGRFWEVDTAAWNYLGLLVQAVFLTTL